jgi:[ribosomal protein S5]-alanine N-acetyltransferase
MDTTRGRHAESAGHAAAVLAEAACAAPEIDWRRSLPVLSGSLITLRELRLSDAASLLARLSSVEVCRFIQPPPTTIDGFERLIAGTYRERAAGRYACYGIVPHRMRTAVGIFQLRQLEAGFRRAEWGFALGAEFWGSGMFRDGARLIVDFAFGVLGARRLEARVVVGNDRAAGALRKVGAVLEGELPGSLLREGQYLNQTLWTISGEHGPLPEGRAAAPPDRVEIPHRVELASRDLDASTCHPVGSLAPERGSSTGVPCAGAHREPTSVADDGREYGGAE